MNEEKLRVQLLSYEPSLALTLKCMLLKECKALQQNPYAYLSIESDKGLTPKDFAKALGLQEENGAWLSEFHHRLGVFLWNERGRSRFETPRVLSLYVRKSAEDHSRSRSYVEQAIFDGRNEFRNENFFDADLGGGRFGGSRFIDCDFSLARFPKADLTDVIFRSCTVDRGNFDGAVLRNTRWEWCSGLDSLQTSATDYEKLADRAVENWTDNRATEQAPKGWQADQIYKMYQTILSVGEGSLTEEHKRRLLEKGKKVRDAVLGASP